MGLGFSGTLSCEPIALSCEAGTLSLLSDPYSESISSGLSGFLCMNLLRWFGGYDFLEIWPLFCQKEPSRGNCHCHYLSSLQPHRGHTTWGLFSAIFVLYSTVDSSCILFHPLKCVSAVLGIVGP